MLPEELKAEVLNVGADIFKNTKLHKKLFENSAKNNDCT